MYGVSCGEMWSVLREGVRKNLGVYIQIHNVMDGRSLPCVVRERRKVSSITCTLNIIKVTIKLLKVCRPAVYGKKVTWLSTDRKEPGSCLPISTVVQHWV